MKLLDGKSQRRRLGGALSMSEGVRLQAGRRGIERVKAAG
jgi:hypothetical protein